MAEIQNQTVRGQAKYLITGSAALFYNKLGTLESAPTDSAIYSYRTSTGTGDMPGWAATTAQIAGPTTVWTVGTDKYEMPAFTISNSYGWELEQAEITAGQGAAATELDNYPDYLGQGDMHPFGTIGYTTNGLSITFTPEWGEIQVDQLLDAARIFKTGQTATLNTTIAEATLENLAIALAVPQSAYPSTTTNNHIVMDLDFGSLYDCPVERSLVAIGQGQGACEPDKFVERVYTAYRALSQEAVTISMSRNDPQTYDVAFRLMPNSAGSYGRIVDRIIDVAADAESGPANPYLI